MPWQRYVGDVSTEIDPETDQLAYDTVIVLVGRQQGKTTLILPKATHRLLSMGDEQRYMYTAQTSEAAKEKWRFKYVAAMKDSYFGHEIADVFYRNHFEKVIFKNGSTFVPITPSAKTGGVGDSVDEACIDEAWCHRDSGIESALSPTMVTRKNSQLWIISTAKRQAEGKPDDPLFAAWLRTKLAEGRAALEAGERTGTAIFDWTAMENLDPMDPATWWSCLPAMGYTTTEAAVQKQLRRMGLADFSAEFLGWWDTDQQLRWQVIPEATWELLRDRGEAPRYPMALAVDTSADRGMTSIVAAGPGRDGTWSVELIENQPGTQWVPDVVKAICERIRPCAVVLATSGAALSLCELLELAGVHGNTAATKGGVTMMSVHDMAAAYGVFHDAAIGTSKVPANLRHLGQDELTTSLSLAWKRRFSGLTVWDWKSPGDVSPVVAASNALWAAQKFGPLQAASDYDLLDSIG